MTGCPGEGGWHHASSIDLVHWDNQGIHAGLSALKETYEGMASDDSPCSGFVTVDHNGTPCAGFRQCGSTKGTTGLNPGAQAWDVPLELRCADLNRTSATELAVWSEKPEYLFPARQDFCGTLFQIERAA